MSTSERGGGSEALLEWSNLPIILDFSLATRFTQAYRELDRFWDAEAKARLIKDRDPLAFRNQLTGDRYQDHVAIVSRLTLTAQPATVVAGSGTCSGGRIANYLNAMLEMSGPTFYLLAIRPKPRRKEPSSGLVWLTAMWKWTGSAMTFALRCIP